MRQMTHKAMDGFSAVWLLLVVIIVFLVWAASFEIDQAVRATGNVIASERTQVVQAVDGGVIDQFLVQEGQKVEKGQLLVKLRKNRALANYDELDSKVASFDLALKRLNAELTGQKLIFSEEERQKWPDFVRNQEDLYTQRKNAMETQISGLKKSLALAEEELDSNSQLLETGDISRNEVLRLQRQVNDIELKIATAKDKYLSDASEQIVRVQNEKVEAEHKLEERQDMLEQTDVRAPASGIIKFIRLTTDGGVLRAGDELMQITPENDDPVIEVKINPADINNLIPGLDARVTFDALDSSTFGSVLGKVVYVSPDTLTENAADNQKSVYYRAHIKIDWQSQDDTTRIQQENIMQGMSASAEIITGQRSVLKYLLTPITRGFAGALTEK